ncbi:MAG TPA: 5'/3'-nucleotidase SurE [Nitrospirales bacterium]|nr:5'/3'-nucleotidase SurE [Nitrospira sp. MA-1]HNP59964.1 5'/3'-nucleotidase SurE [Nitrospirales bacterium]
MKPGRILVTNDDGIGSPGILALAKAMKALGQVWVVAPEKTQNAVGRGMTLHKPLRVRQIRPRWYAVNGTPADCVTLAICKLLETNVPVLVVSGINKGWNLGDDVTNSGTVAGALEGMLHGIPSLAVSLEDCPKASYAMAAHYAVQLAERILKSGLPEGTILNVNVPGSRMEAIAGLQFTSLSQRRYHKPVVEKIDPRGVSYFWIAGERQSWARKKPSDHDAMEKNLVSVTPLHLDLTDYVALNRLKSWVKTFSPKKGTHVSSVRKLTKIKRD